MRATGVPESGGPYCSFCHKPQESVAKLISSPGDYPRAYICDECVGVCAAVLEPEADTVASSEETHPLLVHPLASSLFTAIEQWIRCESLGGDAAGQLAEVRRIARQLIAV